MASRNKPTLDGYASPSELAIVPIPDYEGLPVTQVKTKITKTGDGLSESMSIAPIHIPSEDYVVVVIYAKATKHDHVRATDGTGKDKITLDEFVETVTLQAEGAFLIDPDLVAGPVVKHQQRVAEMREQIAREKREAKGEFGLPFPTEPDDQAEAGPE